MCDFFALEHVRKRIISMNFSGSGQRLSGNDFGRAAAAIGCEEAAIRAVCQVEARGSGFDARNRPVILPERHVFYRNLHGPQLDAAVRAGLAYAEWKPGNYPATQDLRYEQLAEMMAIDAEAALKATSWGLGQVLGENYRLCGFQTVGDMVARCVESEGGQIDVMAGFIIGKGLGKYLVAKDWAGFARGYNGKDYAKNQYDAKLGRAYQSLRSGASAAYNPLSDGLLSVGDKGDVVRVLQTALGLHADGDFGPLTEQAVRGFQNAHHLSVDGKVGRQTGKLLGLTYWG
jgi:peptidoglycan hydrolase-like protein with peptidoglycan-binding domain